MKLITLNIWGAHIYEPFLDFISSNRDIDVFCFQEVYHKAWIDTESIKVIESGMKNLIRQNNALSTRTSFYPKDEKYADYIFTSPEITVNHFEVLSDEVSDHAPLLIDFN